MNKLSYNYHNVNLEYVKLHEIMHNLCFSCINNLISVLLKCFLSTLINFKLKEKTNLCEKHSFNLKSNKYDVHFKIN